MLSDNKSNENSVKAFMTDNKRCKENSFTDNIN